MAIHFSCPSCGDSHPSRLHVADRATFCELVFEGHAERCPLTRAEVRLTHWDMCWKDEAAAAQSRHRHETRRWLLRVTGNRRRREPFLALTRLKGVR